MSTLITQRKSYKKLTSQQRLCFQDDKNYEEIMPQFDPHIPHQNNYHQHCKKEVSNSKNYPSYHEFMSLFKQFR